MAVERTPQVEKLYAQIEQLERLVPTKSPPAPPRSMEAMIEHLHEMRDKAAEIYLQLDALTRQINANKAPPRKNN